MEGLALLLAPLLGILLERVLEAYLLALSRGALEEAGLRKALEQALRRRYGGPSGTEADASG
uniref:Uncharacterized protein n=1 Tax=Thermus caliditerrae TaxID=1330700 RepID=A0A7C5RF32_9DEIN